MRLALFILALALLWTAVTGGLTLANLAFGLAIGAGAAWIMRDSFGRPRVFRRVGQALGLLALFLRELVVSAIRVGLIVVTPNLRAALRPAIVAVPLSVRSDAEIALLANLITLTPGTLSLDVSDDRSTLFVHVLVLHDREALIAEIAHGFERSVRELYA
jgi:multicomponent Na+:H+ antiporter subunit E